MQRSSPHFDDRKLTSHVQPAHKVYRAADAVASRLELGIRCARELHTTPHCHFREGRTELRSLPVTAANGRARISTSIGKGLLCQPKGQVQRNFRCRRLDWTVLAQPDVGPAGATSIVLLGPAGLQVRLSAGECH